MKQKVSSQCTVFPDILGTTYFMKVALWDSSEEHGPLCHSNILHESQ